MFSINVKVSDVVHGFLVNYIVKVKTIFFKDQFKKSGIVKAALQRKNF